MITCPCCGRSPKIGQRRLTEAELNRVPLGQPQGEALTVIEWQCIKAAAEYFEVPDWISVADPTLTYEENMKLMQREGEPTPRNASFKLIRQLES